MQNQHYVPCVYLKPFTYDGNHLHVYDKATDKLLPLKWSSIKSSASEVNFYTLPEDLTQTGDADEVERWLQGVDNQFAALRSGVEDHIKSGYPVDQDLRHDLSSYLGVQIVRTKMYREILIVAYEIEIGNLHSEYKLPIVRPTREQMRAFQANHMQETSARDIGRHLASRLWFLGLNETSVPFFTSDNPVFWQERFLLGVNIGDMIAFPITPRCLLMMYDGEITKGLSKRQFQHYMVNDEEVVTFNALQILQSHLRVYSQVDHFAECQRIRREYPDFPLLDSPTKNAEMLMNSEIAKSERKRFIEQINANRKQ